jgi:hypothetical protein
MKDSDNLVRFACTAAILLHLVACNPQESVTPVEISPAPGHRAAKDGSSPHVEVVRWGPISTVAGITFNIQADGNSGVAFELNQSAPAGNYVVMFDGKPLPGVAVSGGLITATIPTEYLARPGEFQVIIQNISLNMRIMTDRFVVKAP